MESFLNILPRLREAQDFLGGYFGSGGEVDGDGIRRDVDDCRRGSGMEEGRGEGDSDVGVVGEGEGEVVDGPRGFGGIVGGGGRDGSGGFDAELVVGEEP